MFLSDEVSKLSSWFTSQRSDYPWRGVRDPYRVWISEVMLQQTQVSRVIDYFSRWIEAFPTIHDVAAADESVMIKLWEGLGYYSRVRNIHKGAKWLVEHNKGVLPSSYEELIQIPGLGPYTASAVLCFGFGIRALPIDANVERVLARFHGFFERVDTARGKLAIRGFAESWIPEDRPEVVAEGIIEFGQKVCKKVPLCSTCILRKGCKGRGDAEVLPMKKKPKERVYLQRQVVVLVCNEKVWLYKEERDGVMKGLMQFPYDVDVKKVCKADLHYQGEMKTIRHGFTHHTVDLLPHLFFVDEACNLPYGAWYGRSALQTHAFSSGHRTIARELHHALSHHGDALRLLR